MDSTKNKIASNFIWRLLERFGAKGIAFVVSIVLARLLDTNVYGTVALITVITSILQVFVDSGFGTALVQKKDADDLDFSTVFYFNFALCIVLYIGLFFISPLISSFYEMEELTPVIRVLGLIIIISGVKSIQQSYVSRYLLFKKFFFATLGGTIISGIVGIYLAYKGYGVWALVLQNLINQTIDTIILWITVKWRPKLQFSFKRLKKLFSYGWKFLASGLLNTIYDQLRSLIIGKKYSTDDLAYYNKGEQFPQLIETNVNASIDSVLLPVMSKAQDNKEEVKAMCRRSIKIGSFVTIPLLFGLAAVSTPLISLLLTDKWLPAIPYLIIFCITGAFYPVQTANLNAIKAMGRSDIFLVLEIIKKIIGIALIGVSMWFGVFWMAASCAVSCFISMVLNSWPNRKLLGYKLHEQIVDLLPALLLGTIMWAIVYCVNFLKLSNWLTLLIQVPLGAIIYVGGSRLFKFASLTYCVDIVKGLLPRKIKKEVSSND